MARPQRNNVDYFPFICEEGKKMFYLEDAYGNDGFAVFVKLLRELAKSEYHYLDLSKKTTLMFLSAKCKVSNEILESIINDLVDLEKFDSVLWKENRVIWCQDFIDSIQDAYNKRINKCITYDGLLLLLIGLGVRKPDKSTLKAPINPQSIVKDTKEKNRIPPPIDLIKIYQKERGTVVDVNKFFNFYESKNWMVGKNKMKDWQAAFRTWEPVVNKKEKIDPWKI